MFRLAVVEDELDVRSRLVGLIKRSRYPFELIAEYENGVDAYDGIMADSPDLIITDIRVPYIDGIELIKRVRKILPMVKAAVVTGYNEFDYAKEAANLGVISFISKPITAEDVDALLGKAQQILDNEYVTASNLDLLTAFYKSNLPVIHENDLRRLAGMSRVPPAFLRKLTFNQINLNFQYFSMCVFDFDELVEGDSDRFDMAFASVRGLATESFADLCEIELFERNGVMCLILKSNEALPMAEIEVRLERILLRIGRFSGMALSAGVSRARKNEQNFAAMLKEAMHALTYRSVMGGGKVFWYAGAPAAPQGQSVADDDDVREFSHLLRYKTLEDSLQGLERVKARVKTGGAHASYLYTLTSVLNVLLKASDDLEGLLARYGGQEGMYRRVLDSKTADEAFAFFADVTRIIRSSNENLIVDSVEYNFQKVHAYVCEHYCDAELGFETLLQKVNLSASYVSALFKKKLNTSFVKYLTHLRMESAKTLLADPSLKIIDVAEQLGYNDPYYFSHCFKKYTGIAPKEYRNNA